MKSKLITAFLICTVLSIFPTAHAYADDTAHTLSHNGGTYFGVQAVRITSDDDVDIYYTTDGTIPTTASEKYSSKPIIIENSTVLFTVAYRDGMPVEFNGADIKIHTANPTASHNSGTYDSSISVELNCSDDAQIYFTTDGSEPSQYSQQYTAPITVDKDTTLKFFAVSHGKPASRIVTRDYFITTDAYDDPVLQQLFELVNDARKEQGLVPLKEMQQLSDIAQLRSKECASYFSHWRPDGTKWDSLLATEDLKRDVRAENIAYYYTTANSVFNNWMASYYHRSNILNPDTRYIGVGHYDGYCDYWALIFIGEQ